jgi:hypothetical protein
MQLWVGLQQAHRAKAAPGLLNVDVVYLVGISAVARGVCNCTIGAPLLLLLLLAVRQQALHPAGHQLAPTATSCTRTV